MPIPPKSSYRRGAGTSMSAHHILAEVGPWVVAHRHLKVVRELGLERRETVWSPFAVGVGKLKGCPSTRGPEWTNRRSGCHASRMPR